MVNDIWFGGKTTNPYDYAMVNIWLMMMVIIWLMMVNNNTGWWFQPTPLKNHGVKVSWDDMTFPI